MSLILLTRPHFQSKAMADTLSAPCFIEPMLAIAPVATEIDWSRYTDFIVTSPQVFNQVPDLPSHGQYWCVGPASAERAQERGLSVITGPGTGEKLADYISTHDEAKSASFLYLRGRDITFPMVETLQNHGICVEEAIVYESHPCQTLSEALKAHLRDHKIVLAPFYSVKTAKVFIQLLEEAQLSDTVTSITALALSAPIAQVLSTLPFKEILVNDTLANSVIEAYYKFTLDQLNREKAVSESSVPQQKALPKPSVKAPWGFWHGFGLHAFLTLILLIIFWSLLPRFFPSLTQSPIVWATVEKKIHELEQSLAHITPASPPDLSQIQSEISRLEEKLKTYPQTTGVSLDTSLLLPLSSLLRLEHAFVTGQGYEHILMDIKNRLPLKEEDFPQLFHHQKTGFETIPGLLDHIQKSHESGDVVENIPLSNQIWPQALSKFVKVRKHVSGGDQTPFLHQILTLVAQNKWDEAREKIKAANLPATTPWVQEMEQLIEGRRELEKLWQLWESHLSLKSHEEKSS